MRKLLWICHFLPYPPTGHGALQRTHHLIKQAARKYEVHLFVAEPVVNAEQVATALGVRSIQGTPSGEREGRPWKLAKSVLLRRSYWELRFYSRSLHRDLCQAAQEGSPVIVLDTIFLAPYLEHISDCNVVVNHHNIESLLLKQRSSNVSGLKASFFSNQANATRRLEVRICPHVDKNLVVSVEDGTRLSSVVVDTKVSVVANGVDTEYFTRESSSPARRSHSLVFAGGMDWYPNSDAMRWLSEDIWPYIVAREPQCTLTVIGRSPPEELVRLADHDQRVRVLGFVDDVRPHIHSASAYICPIRQGGGTRLKVLDALALECPLVATDLSVDGLALQDRTHYLRANSPHEMYSALCELNASPTLGKKMTSAGRQYVVENFSWERIAVRLFAAIDSLDLR